jgi:hypothetical protein
MIDFTELFATRIAPQLEALEAACRQHRLILRRRAVGFVVLCLGWLAVALALGHPLVWLAAPVLAAVGIFIALQMRAAPGRDYAEALRAIVLPPVCEFAGGWKHGRIDGRDVFSRAGKRVEPDWPLFALPDWRTPVAESVMPDIERLLGLFKHHQGTKDTKEN